MSRPDPIIDEIHRYRRQRAARCGYDAHRIVEDIKERTADLVPNAKIVSFPPKRIEKPVHHTR
jgi:hypothetical protein